MAQDRRVVRTKSALARALFELLAEKEFEKISVTELTRRADVDRKTFYLHYGSVGDILEEFYEVHMTRIQERLERENRQGKLEVLAFFRSLNELLAEDLEMYRRLASGPAYDFFRERLRVILNKRVLSALRYKTPAEPAEALPLYAEFLTAGILSVYLSWLRGELTLTSDQLVDYTSRMVLRGISAITGG